MRRSRMQPSMRAQGTRLVHDDGQVADGGRMRGQFRIGAVQRGGADEQVEIQFRRARRMRDAVSLADGGADFAHDPERARRPGGSSRRASSAKNGSSAGSKGPSQRRRRRRAATPSRLSDARSRLPTRSASTLRSSGSASSGSAGPEARGGFGRKTLLISKSGDFGDAVREVRALDASRPGSSDTRSRFSSRRIVFWTASGSALRPGRDEARRRLVAEGVRHRLEESLAGQHPPREVGEALAAAHAPDHDRQRPAFGNLVVAVDADDFLDQVNLAVHVHGAEGGHLHGDAAAASAPARGARSRGARGWRARCRARRRRRGRGSSARSAA